VRSQTPRLTRRQRVAAIALAAVAAALLTLDLTGGSLDTAHGGVRGLLGSLYRGTDTVLGPVRHFVQGVPHAGSNETRVHALEHENAALRKRLADTAADRHTAAELDRLHLAATDGHYKVLPARVLAISPAEGFDWTVTIDTGSADGVRVGQSVTDGDGLVGRVLHADTSTSVVLLSVDPGAGVGARDLRTGEVGVATGMGTDGFRFRPLDPKAKLRAGDQLDTGPSGSSSYVAGLAIGRITAVRVAATGARVAFARPTTSPTALDLVGVILVGPHSGGSQRSAVHPADLAGGR
jgi:rod shape-determining protein MreC